MKGQGLNLCPHGYQLSSLPLSHNRNILFDVRIATLAFFGYYILEIFFPFLHSQSVLFFKAKVSLLWAEYHWILFLHFFLKSILCLCILIGKFNQFMVIINREGLTMAILLIVFGLFLRSIVLLILLFFCVFWCLLVALVLFFFGASMYIQRLMYLVSLL